MDRDLALKLDEEIKKIRNDMDAVKAYTKTIAEQIEVIAQNTTPAEEPAVETPADPPAGGEE